MTSAAGFSRIPKRGALALVTTVLAVLLLFSFKTADQPALAVLPSAAVIGAPPATTPRPIALGPPPPATTPPARGHTPAPVQPPSSAAPGLGSGTFTGDAIRTPYGTVQVAVTMAAGRIVDVQGVQMPYRPAIVCADQPGSWAIAPGRGAAGTEREHQRGIWSELHVRMATTNRSNPRLRGFSEREAFRAFGALRGGASSTSWARRS